jgi:predicted ester cyclase
MISSNVAEQNKALIRQMMPDFDRTPLEATHKWMTPDFTTSINGGPPMDLESYRQLATAFEKSFSNIRHEIIDLVAEGDRVALVMTLHLMHTGEYEGVAATGRSLKVAEMSVFTMREGRIASERLFFDFANFQQQLTAS